MSRIDMLQQRRAEEAWREELLARFESCARALTGRRCIVSLRPPVDIGWGGQCFLTPGGTGIIDLDPRVFAWSDRFATFLHECGHLKLNHAAADAHEYLLPAASVPPTRASVAAWQTSPLESAADIQAKAWLLESDKGVKNHQPQPDDPPGWETFKRLVYLEIKHENNNSTW